MSLPDNFTQHEVNNAVAELKACLHDAKEVGSYDELESYLPRLAYLLRHDQVLVHLLKELPKAEIEYLLFKAVRTPPFREYPLRFPTEPKARLSEQIAILMAIEEGELDL